MWERLCHEIGRDLSLVPGVTKVRVAAYPASADAATLIVSFTDDLGVVNRIVYDVRRSHTGNGGGTCS